MKTAKPVIRGERPDDVEGIESLLRRAFENHPHSQQTEHLIVARLRAAGVTFEGVPPEYFLTRPFIGAAPVAEVSYNPAFFLTS